MANSIPGVSGSASSAQVDIVETSRASKQEVQGATQSAAEPASSLLAGDATVLSNLGTFIATAARTASLRSSIRPDLVASLKAQLAAGTYHPDPDEVAARVVAAIKP
jgi:anti-sigma28 factor (negative regulator of flagellin synthesis)